MATTIDLTQHHALNRYVATGKPHYIDGGAYFDSPSDGSPVSNVAGKWRKNIGPAIIVVDSKGGEPQSLPTEPTNLTRPVLVRRRSTGQQTPSPTTSLPANSRTEASVPRDISTWRQAIPLGCKPPDDIPWTSPLGDEPSGSEEHVTHSDPKPDADVNASSSSTPPTSLPPGSPNMAIHQWRYENYVDWWRGGVAAQNGDIEPPPQNADLDDAGSSRSVPRRITVLDKRGEGEQRPPPVLSVPPPPPPPPQVIRVVEIPPLQVSSSPTRGNNHGNLKRVYYRLITRTGDPVPVREISRTNSMIADSSIGVLFLENPSAQRAKDLITRILSREYANSPTPSSTFSPRLRQKFAEQNVTGASLASPTHDAFVINKPICSEAAAKVKLYCHGTNGKTKGKKLRSGDRLPKGVGIDEQSALVVEVHKDDSPPPYCPNKKKGHPAMVGAGRKGIAAVLRGLALGLRSVGDGLGKFADCLSGTGSKSRVGSFKGQ